MENITFVTPEEKIEVVIRGRATARLEMTLKKIWLKDETVDMAELKRRTDQAKEAQKLGKEVTETEIATDKSKQQSALLLLESEEAVLEVMVLSVGGDSTRVLDALLDMSPADYKAVQEEVNKITDRDQLTDEKKSA